MGSRSALKVLLLLVAALVVAIAAGCGGGGDEASPASPVETGGGATPPPAEDVSGTVEADGSSTVGPLTTAAAELFQEANSGVTVTVGISGTGGGFERFCAGETDVSDASRPIKEDEEVPACRENGVEYIELPVAVDALTVVVNTENDWATCLTVEQLKTMWEPAAEGSITNWNQIDPSFPDESLVLAGAGTDSGTFDYFTDAINGEEGASRADYTASEDDNVTVQAVEGEKGALGYFGYTYYEQNADRLKAVEIDGGSGCVAPSPETARDGTYAPLSRPLFIYVNRAELAENPALAPFVQFYLDNIDTIAEAALFIPPSDEQKATAADVLAGALGGLVSSTDDPAPAGAEPGPRLRAPRRRYGEDLVKVLLGLCAVISIATTVGIVISLVEPAFEFFREVDLVDFVTGSRWAPLFEPPDFGVVPLLAGTFSVTVWASLVCLPFGLGSAIYLSEYATPRVRKTLKPALEILAGIPTVVFGYFALTFLTPLLKDLGLDLGTFNALSAGLIVGIMVLPTVASLSEDAMSAVPRDLRSGAYALGATRFKVSTRVVVPAAVSGIIASFVLAISRIVGETMIVLIAAGQQPKVTLDPRSPVETMTAFIGATGQGDVPTGSLEYKTIFAVGLTLFALTLAMNVVSIRLVRKYREIYE